MFESQCNDTVLEAAQKAGVEIYSECKSGFCGACKCKLKSGKVIKIRDTIAYTEEGCILTCSVKAETDIEILPA
nr:2Fe-2S iron-sulfur cluster-binding protein [Vibrio diazotrophicus]